MPINSSAKSSPKLLMVQQPSELKIFYYRKESFSYRMFYWMQVALQWVTSNGWRILTISSPAGWQEGGNNMLNTDY